MHTGKFPVTKLYWNMLIWRRPATITWKEENSSKPDNSNGIHWKNHFPRPWMPSSYEMIISSWVGKVTQIGADACPPQWVDSPMHFPVPNLPNLLHSLSSSTTLSSSSSQNSAWIHKKWWVWSWQDHGSFCNNDKKGWWNKWMDRFHHKSLYGDEYGPVSCYTATVYDKFMMSTGSSSHKPLYGGEHGPVSCYTATVHKSVVL